MNISNTVEYGLLAVGYVANNSEDGLVKSSSISKKYSIPEFYLFSIMQKLVEVNILKGRRGPKGGYTLTRPAKEISMLEIIEAVGGPLEQTKGITRYTKHSQFAVKMEAVCKDAFEKEKKILQNAKISQMIK